MLQNERYTSSENVHIKDDRRKWTRHEGLTNGSRNGETFNAIPQHSELDSQSQSLVDSVSNQRSA